MICGMKMVLLWIVRMLNPFKTNCEILNECEYYSIFLHDVA